MAPRWPRRGGASARSARPGVLRAASAALAVGAAVATWCPSARSSAFGAPSRAAASGIRGAREPLVRLGAVKESLKAEDIGKMYATGDADMDELADTTWKDHFNVAFQSMDNDKDGKISLEDFAHALSEMGQPFTNLKQDGIATIFDLADSSSTGHIDFDEFIAWQKSTRSLLESFMKLDIDHDGVISKEEWREAITGAGVDWTPEECDDAFDDADTNGNGVIDFAEYTVWAAKA